MTARTFDGALRLPWVASARMPSRSSALVRLMEKDEADLRYAAMYALMGVGPSASAPVPALVKMLSHDDFHTRVLVVPCLGRIGAPAQDRPRANVDRPCAHRVASVRRMPQLP